jgi:hypothetical protein
MDEMQFIRRLLVEKYSKDGAWHKTLNTSEGTAAINFLSSRQHIIASATVISQGEKGIVKPACCNITGT